MNWRGLRRAWFFVADFGDDIVSTIPASAMRIASSASIVSLVSIGQQA